MSYSMTSTNIEFDLDPYLEMIILAILSIATNFQASIIKVNNVVVNGCTIISVFQIEAGAERTMNKKYSIYTRWRKPLVWSAG